MSEENTFCKTFYVSRETNVKIVHYYELLQKWNVTHNLIQRSDLENFWLRHAADSAQLIKYIPSLQTPIFDLGSGAGFPGLILSILAPNPIFLFESNQKKVVFLEYVIHTLGLTAKVISGRIEDTLKNCFEKQTHEIVVTSRALGSVNYILSLVLIVSRETIFLFHKSKNQLKEEIPEALAKWDFEWEVLQSLTHADGTILRITQAKRKT